MSYQIVFGRCRIMRSDYLCAGQCVPWATWHVPSAECKERVPMTRVAIAHQRLAHQHISGERCRHPYEVVKQMGALQAQDYQQALWAVGLRMTCSTLTSVEQVLASGKIVLTWTM